MKYQEKFKNSVAEAAKAYNYLNLANPSQGEGVKIQNAKVSISLRMNPMDAIMLKKFVDLAEGWTLSHIAGDLLTAALWEALASKNIDHRKWASEAQGQVLKELEKESSTWSEKQFQEMQKEFIRECESDNLPTRDDY